MSRTHHWDLPSEAGLPDNIVFGGPEQLWVAGAGAGLLQLGAEGAVRAVPVLLDGQRLKVLFVEQGTAKELWLIVETGERGDRAGRFDPERGVLQLVELSRPPRQLVWCNETRTLWFLATDTTLNRFDGRQTLPVEEGRFNKLLAGPGAGQVLARRISDGALLLFEGESGKSSVLAEGVTGEPVGFGADGALISLKQEVWKKGQAPPDSRVLRRTGQGTSEELVSGPIVRAVARGRQLATVGQRGDRLSVESWTLR